ncbi:MAG: EcsC family protein [Propioniciclava sp.]|uniref:hypothetical protein n=1 Tax=Propioniciclava sp. TaxID=2038686 RepID=UPI0039E2C5FF
MTENVPEEPRTIVARASEGAGNALRTLLEIAINGSGVLPGAKTAAAKQLVKADSVEEAVEALVLGHAGLAAAQGFVTNLGGLATMAVGLPANIAGLAVVQTRLVAAIAHLRGYDIDSRQVRTALVLTLLGADGVDRLIRLGTLPTTPLAIATAPVFDRSLDRVVSEKVLASLAGRIGGRNAAVLFARRIPLLGGGVSGAMDGVATVEIGAYAREQFVRRRRLTPG